jgi:hypothetical protein
MKRTLSISIISLFMVASALFSFNNPNRKTAEVRQVDGIYIYYMSLPVDKYESLGEVRTGGVILNKHPETVIPFVIKRVKKQYPNANGVIMERNMFDAQAITVE